MGHLVSSSPDIPGVTCAVVGKNARAGDVIDGCCWYRLIISVTAPVFAPLWHLMEYLHKGSCCYLVERRVTWG